jgi:hypothetical protein
MGTHAYQPDSRLAACTLAAGTLQPGTDLLAQSLNVCRQRWQQGQPLADASHSDLKKHPKINLNGDDATFTSHTTATISYDQTCMKNHHLDVLHATTASNVLHELQQGTRAGGT